jgi:hypothetical protein
MWLWIVLGIAVLAILALARGTEAGSAKLDLRQSGSADPKRRPIRMTDPNLFGVCSKCRNHGNPKRIAEYQYQVGSSTRHIGLCSEHARLGYVVED